MEKLKFSLRKKNKDNWDHSGLLEVQEKYVLCSLQKKRQTKEEWLCNEGGQWRIPNV